MPGQKRKRSQKGAKRGFKRRRGSSSFPWSRRRSAQTTESVSGRNSASKVVIRQPSGAPDDLFVKLRYNEVFQLSSTSGSNGEYLFRGNSLFDPDLTGTGTQPLFFDQWSTIYATYTVMGSSIMAKFMPDGNLTGAGFRCAIAPLLGITTLGATKFDVASQTPSSRVGLLYNSPAPLTLRQYCSTARIFGITQAAVLTDTTLSAANSANPANQWTWHVCIQSSDLSSTVTGTVDVDIMYYVRFSQRNVVTSS